MKIRYRGFNIKPFLRWKAIRIGNTRLYTIGPVAIFVRGKK